MSDIDERFSRNIGLIQPEQQKRLAQARVAVCGVGGMGGVCAEVLARMGVGNLVLADHDTFERSNINRQIHCNETTLGRNKAEVVADQLQLLNPSLNVRVFDEGVTDANVAEIVADVDVLVNGMDRMRNSLALERCARERNKPIVDAWLTPYASVFVMRPDSPHWEDYLDLPTRGLPLDELTPELCHQAVDKEVAYTFSHGDPYRYVDRSLIEDVIYDRKPRPSLAPVVWLSGVMMANEVFKLLTDYPTTDHIGVIYDQYEHRQLLAGADD